MKKQMLLLALIAVFLLPACQTQPEIPVEDISVESKFNHKVKLNNYKSYSWLSSAEILIDPNTALKSTNFSVNEVIVSHINNEMKGQGLSETENDPDLYISYVLGVNMDRLKLKNDPDTGLLIKKNVPKGELLIALIDAKTEYVVWVASAHAGVKNLKSDMAKKRIQFAIEAMFKKLPKS